MIAMCCVQCGGLADLARVDGECLCRGCIVVLLDGAIPERIAWKDARPVYWWWCVCGCQIRRGPYTVDRDALFNAGEIHEREYKRIGRYRNSVEAVSSAGVMLCQLCAVAAGVPLPAPAPLRLPDNVIVFDRDCFKGRRVVAPSVR